MVDSRGCCHRVLDKILRVDDVPQERWINPITRGNDENIRRGHAGPFRYCTFVEIGAKLPVEKIAWQKSAFRTAHLVGTAR